MRVEHASMLEGQRVMLSLKLNKLPGQGSISSRVVSQLVLGWCGLLAPK